MISHAGDNEAHAKTSRQKTRLRLSAIVFFGHFLLIALDRLMFGGFEVADLLYPFFSGAAVYFVVPFFRKLGD